MVHIKYSVLTLMTTGEKSKEEEQGAGQGGGVGAEVANRLMGKASLRRSSQTA